MSGQIKKNTLNFDAIFSNDKINKIENILNILIEKFCLNSSQTFLKFYDFDLLNVLSFMQHV